MRSLFSTILVLLIWVQPTTAQRLNPIVAKVGKRPALNYLENLSLGAKAGDPVDQDKPTIVITHGWNPAPELVRLTTPQAYAKRVVEKYGDRYNVMAWNWDSRYQGSRLANDSNAQNSGRQLGMELIRRGVVPSRTTLIGHSMGTIVIAAAASHIKSLKSENLAELCLIDAPSGKFQVVYHELCSNGCANRVRNFWVGGVTGIGAPMELPGIENIRAPIRKGRHRVAGNCLFNHVDILVWFHDYYL
ncbi:MAG: hypothetical protein AAF497_14720 [Planctomycetota bacterium]